MPPCAMSTTIQENHPALWEVSNGPGRKAWPVSNGNSLQPKLGSLPNRTDHIAVRHPCCLPQSEVSRFLSLTFDSKYNTCHVTKNVRLACCVALFCWHEHWCKVKFCVQSAVRGPDNRLSDGDGDGIVQRHWPNSTRSYWPYRARVLRRLGSDSFTLGVGACLIRIRIPAAMLWQ